jgi:hypothetical protein
MVAEPRPPSFRPQKSSPELRPDSDSDVDVIATEYQAPQRLFLHEPGWHVGLKVGSERTFCYQMAPGQDYYHRLFDGEVYLFRGDERLCLACAERRGLLSYAPKGLKPPPPHLALDTDADPDDPGFDLKDLEELNG